MDALILSNRSLISNWIKNPFYLVIKIFIFFSVLLKLLNEFSGNFTYEKHFAGKYIGELVRMALLKLHQESLFLPGQNADILTQNGVFETSDLSDVEKDLGSKKPLYAIHQFHRLNLIQFTDDDVAILRHVCAVLSHRCALMVALPLAVFLRRMAKDQAVGIAVTGSLYKHHPRLRDLLEKYVHQYSDGFRCYTFLSDDGSGKGAGLVAAIADRMEKEGH